MYIKALIREPILAVFKGIITVNRTEVTGLFKTVAWHFDIKLISVTIIKR